MLLIRNAGAKLEIATAEVVDFLVCRVKTKSNGAPLLRFLEYESSAKQKESWPAKPAGASPAVHELRSDHRQDWHISAGRLYTPERYELNHKDFSWWSLLVCLAADARQWA